jgi:transglutaminase-like putative cysteine protease
MPLAPAYLQPTAILDSGHPEVRRYALATVGEARDDAAAAAVRLFYAVRDDIWYDPYVPFYRAEHYRASRVLESRRGFCISKAGLLCALGRACGIPSRLGFADVRNHLATRELIARMGGDLFVYHGFTEFYLGGKWIKATPTFNQELCRKHRVAPLEFDGRSDAVFQPFNLEAAQYMTYVRYHPPQADIPLEAILTAWRAAYGQERVESWIAAIEAAGGRSAQDFSRETVWRGPQNSDS